MKYIVDCDGFYDESWTYRDAEIYCGVHGIHPENIYEEEE